MTGLALLATLDSLDRLDTGVLVLDRGGRIIHANAPAGSCLRENADLGALQALFYLREQRLQVRFALALQDAITAAGGNALGQAPAALAIERAGRLPLPLSVASLRSRWSRGFDPGPLALVFPRDPEAPAPHLDQLRELLGLTATEAVIAADLGAGRAPEEIARRQHIGNGTVRWHLKSILGKTGTTRQAEAAALPGRNVAALPGKNTP